jgi:hypothetical protein
MNHALLWDDRRVHRVVTAIELTVNVGLATVGGSISGFSTTLNIGRVLVMQQRRR